MTELLRPGAEAGAPVVFYAMGWTLAQDGDARVVGHAGATFNFARRWASCLTADWATS
jgi:hypothetical protein